MNTERLLRTSGDAVGLFRGVFKAAVGRLVDQGQKVMDIRPEGLVQQAHEEQEKRRWYFENDDVTPDELQHFDEVMTDYLRSLHLYLADVARPEAALERCFQELFS
ncbi:hypothetical protein [Deinococcus altitudinis]|uniref:hypothetical protein n=1 Tax=Deinococcus altitudinis TaxID=468914 RepID=UPI003891217B